MKHQDRVKVVTELASGFQELVQRTIEITKGP
jgi:hypothetical protein